MYCVFCEIVAENEPANIRYQDDDIIVIDNRLRWVPVMLLVMPKEHIPQEELWASDLMPRMGQVALEMGRQFCPRGFRLLANFGYEAMQSQDHGHLHILGGTHLGPYA